MSSMNSTQSSIATTIVSLQEEQCHTEILKQRRSDARLYIRNCACLRLRAVFCSALFFESLHPSRTVVNINHLDLSLFFFFFAPQLDRLGLLELSIYSWYNHHVCQSNF